MIFLIGILTVLLVLNSALLIFLVLVQLPKKDAGAGLAFGGGAADALFGAGSGNALTKITKYAIVIFFILSVALGYSYESSHRTDVTGFERAMQQKQTEAPMAPNNAAPAPAPATTPGSSTETPAPAPASIPAATGSNAPAK